MDAGALTKLERKKSAWPIIAAAANKAKGLFMKCNECGRSFYWDYKAAGYHKPICADCAEGKD